ncbi:B3 domain-containing transcription factor VRN1-like [Papaver somniferum]|uniref:B3 domain-containing transcription factor VRN1-like n=1 Tax=Papaver somniferum TaxID=3469 RepID=UPI000E7036B2|nr:B3 domain-containing transcription factor VRN1-like [Papaver somniferum]
MQFFKILDASSHKNERLELPKEFIVKYGKELSYHAIIKVPNGIWHIGLRNAEGAMLFENGWPQFMEFYSICVGHVLLFRYDGDSKFQVHAFGIDATEIEYPSHNPIHSGGTHSNSEPSMSSDSPLNSGSTQSNYEASMSSESSYDQNAEPGRQEFSQKRAKQRTVIPTRIHTKAFKAILEAAEAFKSENPSFKLILQASHFKGTVKVPIAFTSLFLRNVTRMVITLGISDGRTWEVGYVSRTYNEKTESTLSKGWCKFLADNHLMEGDVCVFELVDREKIKMNVQFFKQQKAFARKINPKIRYYAAEFKATREAVKKFTSDNPFYKRVHLAFATSHFTNITRMVITLRVSDGRTWEVRYVSRSPKQKVLSQGWHKFVADNDLKEGNVCVFELVDRKNVKMLVHIFRQQKPSARELTPKSSKYTAQFHATLDAAETFTSKNPFFKVVMQAAHMKKGMLRVPAAFGTQHLTDITRMVITLKVADDKTWEVNYVSGTPTERRISLGWREFVADNDLKEGDVCIFELVDFGKKLKMNVHIFRLVQDMA